MTTPVIVKDSEEEQSHACRNITLVAFYLRRQRNKDDNWMGNISQRRLNRYLRDFSKGCERWDGEG